MLKQNLSQKQLQKLSPQQIQLMKLLQVPTVMLEQRIQEELEANPALEDSKEDLNNEEENTEELSIEETEPVENSKDDDINEEAERQEDNSARRLS